MKLNLLAPLLFLPPPIYFAVQLVRRQPGREVARELGWALPVAAGWLRWRSESVVPSGLVHAMANALGALLVFG